MRIISRRAAVTLIAGSAALPLASPRALALPAEVTKDQILNDPDAPVSGNPKGDVTIVAFFDYNCPYCKKSAPDLERIVREDAKIRLVYKDWPILTEASVYGAQLALAAKYQGKYETVHLALMGIPGHRVGREEMAEAVRASDIDRDRLNRDLAAHAADIAALLKRNLAQADALGLRGTPTFLIGPFMSSTLDYAGFKQVVADARARGGR
jgi:protein-disulfide isomerase